MANPRPTPIPMIFGQRETDPPFQCSIHCLHWKGRERANSSPTPKPTIFGHPWTRHRGKPAGYSRGRRMSVTIEKLIEEMPVDRKFAGTETGTETESTGDCWRSRTKREHVVRAFATSARPCHKLSRGTVCRWSLSIRSRKPVPAPPRQAVAGCWGTTPRPPFPRLGRLTPHSVAQPPTIGRAAAARERPKRQLNRRTAS